jgi:hypothetical protein
MAAERRYLTGDGTMGTPGNWIGETGNIVPIAGDTAIVGKLCAADATDVGGALSTIDLAALEVHRTYKYSFGTSAAPILMAGALFKLYSSGPVFIECHLNAAALNIDQLRIAMARPDVVCEIGSVTADAGEIVDIWVSRGRCTFKANTNFAAASRLTISYINGISGDANVIIAAGADTLPTLVMNGGFCTAANVITSAVIASGTLVKTTTKITTAYIQKDGILNYEHTAIAGDNTAIHVLAGGTLDLLTNEVPKNIDDVFVHPGGTIRYDPTLHTFSGTYGLVNMRNEVLP